MRLRKGADVLNPKKKIGLFVSACVRRKGMDYSLCHVGMREMQSIRSQMPKKNKILGIAARAKSFEIKGVRFFGDKKRGSWCAATLWVKLPVDKM